MKLIQIAFKLNAIYSLYRCYICVYIYICYNVCTYAYEILPECSIPETWKFLKAGSIISPFGHWINWHSFIWMFLCSYSTFTVGVDWIFLRIDQFYFLEPQRSSCLEIICLLFCFTSPLWSL